jgi:hypothetical protein
MAANNKVNKIRAATLVEIYDQQHEIDEMVQRAAACGDPVDETLLSDVRAKLAAINDRANAAELTAEELRALELDARYQGQLSAYFCPQREVADEGSLCIDELEEWSVPSAVISKLRSTLGDKISRANEDLATARSALRALFEEYDSWDGYTDDYESTMDKIALWLLIGVAVSLPCSIARACWGFPTTRKPTPTNSNFPKINRIGGLADGPRQQLLGQGSQGRRTGEWR